MRLCFVADARSPIAQNWIRYFTAGGHEVHLISSYPYSSDSLPFESMHVVPVAFSGLLETRDAKGNGVRSQLTPLLKRLRNSNMTSFLYSARHWLGPLDAYRRAGQTRRIIEEIRPDLVHAMRIPFEGMLAAEALREVGTPFLISTWGNDFTLFARRFPLVAWMTRWAMKRADALHTDCDRDIRLANMWGFDKGKPAIVLPGAGGIQTQTFCPAPATASLLDQWAVPEKSPIVLNPRGLREYVCNDSFFSCIPLVLDQIPDVVFVALGMEGSPIAQRSVKELRIAHAIRLLPQVTRNKMADLFRLADVAVSPSEHDGTPNTLLEAMACGCFPVAGDIESVREWIIHGVNGLLCNPASPEALAQAILRALNDPELRETARQYNVKLITERAEYGKVMAQAEQFYCQVIEHARSKRKHI